MLNKLAGVPAGVQAIEAVGTVTTDDYHRVFAPLVDEACRTRDRLRLLYRFGPGFERITRVRRGQTPDSGQTMCDCSTALRSSATSTGSIPTRRIAMFMPTPVRVYDDSGVSDALTWLQSLPRNTGTDFNGRIKVFHTDPFEYNDTRLNSAQLQRVGESPTSPTIDPGAITTPFAVPGDEDWYEFRPQGTGTFQVKILFDTLAALGNGRPGLPGNGDLSSISTTPTAC